MERHACNGTFRNGPYKAYVRCDRCGAIDYERNEGDLHPSPARTAREPIACWLVARLLSRGGSIRVLHGSRQAPERVTRRSLTERDLRVVPRVRHRAAEGTTIMGATDFWTVAKGKDAKDAFDEATRRARHENGHGGYTGTIAEKRSFRVLDVPSGKDPKDYAGEIADADSHGYHDKWGPALCVELGEGKYLFFGLASS